MLLMWVDNRERGKEESCEERLLHWGSTAHSGVVTERVPLQVGMAVELALSD
jgi:hypothetical protein